MKSELIPVGEIPSVDYQGEVASFDGNPNSVFVSPSEDLVAKPGANLDSWFLTSRLQSSRGSLDLLVHLLHTVPPAGGPGVMGVMASVLDSSTGRYASEEQDFPGDQCSFATEKCEVITPLGSVSGDAQALHVAGSWPQAGISCDLTVSQSGPMLANAGTGLWPAFGGVTYHYALPTMTTAGTVTIGGERLEVDGESWLDRQWGASPKFFVQDPKRWIWFGIRLDDGTRISCWDLIEHDRRHSWATVLAPNGAHEVVTVSGTVERASEPWTSPATGQTYPTSWDVEMPQIDSRLVIRPDVVEQEFVSPVGANKYEASAPVTGTFHGRQVNGYATIELVGDWR